MNTLLTTVLKRYKLFPTNILVLGDEEILSIGTRWSSHQIRGIVSNRELVDQTKQSHPSAKLYAQKLESYRITWLMQLTYALHGQLNTIPTVKRWDMFATISKHTSPYGLVVLDIKLPAYYETQSKLSSTPQISTNLITLSSRQHKKWSYIYDQTKLEAIPEQPDLYRKTQTITHYYSMTLTEIKKLAAPYFETVSILDLKGKPLTKSADHIIIVCQKGGPDWKAKIV
jgi:hypothetical protein